MTFDSTIYAAFLPLVLAAYYVLNRTAQNVLLLAASYLFYGWWDARFLGLLAFSTLVDYVAGRGIEGATPNGKRNWLAISIIVNLGVLAFFKYFRFFADSAAVLGEAVGWTIPRTTLDIVLPVGISFYTFQSMAYTIDVYRGHLKACRDPITFALYVSYFPQLVAGPIERASRLIPQLESRRRVRIEDWQEGLFLIAMGLFKKVGVSNALAPTVDAVFGYPAGADGLSLWLGVYAFAAQIYCDFSGYSDIARGSSRLMGIELMRNFRHPYFASTFREYWHRWHISLSQWLRDYVYIPLGGNRQGARPMVRNLLLTMTLGGLWHGAAWHFVAWGVWHGLLLVGERALPWNRGERTSVSRIGRLAASILVFHGIALGWVLFRCESVADVHIMLTGIVTWQTGERWLTHFEIGRIAILAGCVLSLDLVAERAGNEYAILDWRWGWRGVAWGCLAAMTLVLGGVHVQTPFIYFQF
ncbi:MAG: MBOAT family protein [Candidatus Hydrogenedentes bacterium]|nr:MBOAT family protein [Candidatus Hydrogenedentota bacterium]